MDFNDLKELGDAYLAHHGVEGQQWGVQNGPPYPLEGKGKKNFIKQVKENRKKKRRKRIMKDPKKLVKYQDEFTVEELDEALKKIDAVNRVRERIPKKEKPSGLTAKQKRMASDPATLARNMDKFDDDDYQKAYNRLKRERELQNMTIEDAKRPAKILDIGNAYISTIGTGISNVKTGITNVAGIHDAAVTMSGKPGLKYEDQYKLNNKKVLDLINPKKGGKEKANSMAKDVEDSDPELAKYLREYGSMEHDDLKTAGEDFLMHYGVIGMKWGVHKAKEYERDIAMSRRNKKIRAAKNEVRSRQGSTRYDDRKYLKEVQRNADVDFKKDLLDIKNKYSNVPKKAKGVKRSEIWKDAERRAKSEIPNYAVKHSIRKAAKIAGLATMGLGAAMGTTAGIAMAATGESFLNALSVGSAYALEGAVEGALVSKVPGKIVKGKL